MGYRLVHRVPALRIGIASPLRTASKDETRKQKQKQQKIKQKRKQYKVYTMYVSSVTGCKQVYCINTNVGKKRALLECQLAL